MGKLERGELTDSNGNKATVLVITVAPRFGKTQFVSIDWPARCIAKNPRAKFIHLSYSEELALDNSTKCRETVQSHDYQNFWNIQIKGDSDSKKKWYTKQGGGMYATAAGGAVTGFGAGSLADVKPTAEDVELREIEEAKLLAASMDSYFSEDQEPIDPSLFYGAIVIDDPIKVDDAASEIERTRVNNRLNSTIKSRRNSRNTPIVIVMQRVHEDDMAGFVLAGGIGEPVHHLNLPAIVNYGTPHARSLWPAKHTLEELEAMKIANNAVFMAQYMQNPTPDEGTFFLSEYFNGRRFRLGEEPTRLVKYGAGDYAVTEDSGDWTEQAIAGFDLKEDLYILDWHSARVTLDKSIDTMCQMVLEHDPMLWAAETGVIRRAMEPYIMKEQQRRRIPFKLEWLPATKSKAVNAKAFQALCAAKKVWIPYGSWGDDLIAQLLKFTGKDDKIDDKVDVCGIFGRLLNHTMGPSVYHDAPLMHNKDYGVEEDDASDSGNGTIPI